MKIQDRLGAGQIPMRSKGGPADQHVGIALLEADSKLLEQGSSTLGNPVLFAGCLQVENVHYSSTGIRVLARKQTSNKPQAGRLFAKKTGIF
jgi:hypothetical protein